MSPHRAVVQRCLMLAVAMAVSSCGGGTDSGATASPAPSPAPAPSPVPGPSPAPGVGLNTRPSNTTCFAFEPTGSSTASLTLQRAFSSLSFNQPVALLQAPGDATRWFVVEKGGTVRVFPSGGGVATTFVDISAKVVAPNEEAGLLGMAFDPNFATNRYFYLFYTGARRIAEKQLTTVIARFSANAAGTSADSNSEVRLIGLDRNGTSHNGGNLAFGPDGYLYAAFGDGRDGNDPRYTFGTPQDVTSLFGKFIRIDPSRSTGQVPYAVPSDNPYASASALCNVSGFGSPACPEIWARGFRNPWRWSFDRGGGGQLWAGDVGESSFEEVDIVVKDGNYGWPNIEGVCTSNCSGYTDPVYAVPRSVGQTITGGHVYRGTQTTDLAGQYIFGDYSNGAFAAIDTSSHAYRSLIDPFSANHIFVSSFGEAVDGELYALDFAGGGIWRLILSGGNGGGTVNPPSTLSATGCAAAGNVQQAAGGMVGYDLNAPFWSDNALKSRWLALPSGTAALSAGTDGDWTAPAGSVFRKDFRLNNVLVETRLLMRQTNGTWAGYSYEWNGAQSDANLVTAAGKDKVIAGPNGNQTWSYPARTQCLECHTAAAGFSLGLETQQLNRSFTYSQTGTTANQLTTLSATPIAMLTPRITDPTSQPSLPDPAGTASVALRARAWLHSNCSMCHRPGTSVPTSMNLLAGTPLASTGTCNVDPGSGTLGLTNPKIVSPGAPDSSVLLARVNALDANRMPPLGSHVVDSAGAALLRSWIADLTSCN